MGKASSGKKVARAARAGGGLTRRRNSSYGYPSFIALVVILGVVLIAFSRNQNFASAAPISAPTKDLSAPRPDADHWHTAVGFDICGKFEPNFKEFENQAGIHTHGDGVIHIHPFSIKGKNPFSGKNANLGAYMRFVRQAEGKGTVTAHQIKLPGVSKVNGDKCSGKTSEVQIKTWKKGEPEEAGQTYTGDPEKLVLQDNMLLTVAFLPKGDKIPQPPSAPQLDQLTDVGPTTDTTLPGGVTGTTVPGATATTAPAATATTAPASPTTAKP
jgi:hypothetical protein